MCRQNLWNFTVETALNVTTSLIISVELFKNSTMLYLIYLSSFNISVLMHFTINGANRTDIFLSDVTKTLNSDCQNCFVCNIFTPYQVWNALICNEAVSYVIKLFHHISTNTLDYYLYHRDKYLWLKGTKSLKSDCPNCLACNIFTHYQISNDFICNSPVSAH